MSEITIEETPGFMAFQAGLPRQGPGDPALLLRLIAALGLTAPGACADLGCGTGATARLLAETFDAEVLALDASADFVAALPTPARGTVRGVVGDMLDPPAEPSSLDLVVSEGAAYLVGWEAALRAWRPLLRPGGGIVASDAVWLGPERPPEAAAFWAREYPDLRTPAQCLAQADAAGLRLVAAERLRAAAWRASYYDPARAHAAAVEGDPALMEAAAAMVGEADFYDRTCDAWGYMAFAFDVAG